MKACVIATLALLSSFSAVAADAEQQALIKQGEYLARAGDCVACHTAKGGKPFAGGLAMETPIGTLYSTNITPDKTGIGAYSFEDFDNAVRHGIAKTAVRCTRPCRTRLMHGSTRPTCRRCMPTLCAV